MKREITCKRIGMVLVCTVFLFLTGSPQSQNVTEQEYIIYCCTNHKPSHCGDRDQLKDLEAEYGCTGWEASSPIQ